LWHYTKTVVRARPVDEIAAGAADPESASASRRRT